MEETGIIMSGNHPKLIIDGLKTMTRRVIKFKPEPSHIEQFKETWLKSCPYGQVGDRLWVKETWKPYEIEDIFPDYKALVEFRDGNVKDVDNCMDADWWESHKLGIWRPSLFMPRWASRIERIIALLKVEQLRDISEADAQAEGGYTIEEFIRLYLKINHLSEDANPWNWAIGW